MVAIRPMRIPGRWRDGRALDVHTVSSVYVGDDEFGHARFETRRSAMGDLLYRLKYRTAATSTLYDQGHALEVYALTLTRTRSRQ